MNNHFKTHPHATLLTANRRLAATLFMQYSEYECQQGNAVWSTPSILPLSAWIFLICENAIVQGKCPPALLLNEHQQQALWESIIASSSSSLLRLTETAMRAKEARSLLESWQIPGSHPSFSQTEESKTFQSWCQTYDALCREKRWLTLEQATSSLINLIEEEEITSFPSQIVLIGFIEFSPLEERLFTALRNRGVEIICDESPLKETHAYLYAAKNQTTELQTMAAWANENIITGKCKTVGCVVPSLSDIRPQVERVFRSLEVPFNISAGLPLHHYPLIAHALLALEFNQGEMSYEKFTLFLLSPFFSGAEQERAERSLLDVQLRKLKLPILTLQTLLSEGSACPQLHACFMQLRKTLPPPKTRFTFNAWSELFQAQLNLLGWPGERTLDSTEFQLCDQWQKLLSEFEQLDQILPSVTFNEACEKLHTLAGNTLFQPKTDSAPIQILGVLEATGLSFDAIWIMGLHDGAWPSAPKPHPFIPLSLQKSLSLPHATADRELHYTRVMTDHFLRSAPKVFFSYPQIEEDRELRPSALISFFPRVDFISNVPTTSFKKVNFEYIDDTYGPQIQENEKIRGGTAIFKEQAACPFRAFAKYRLEAQAFSELHHALDAIDRGNLIHRALEHIWKTLANYEILINHSEEKLREIIREGVIAALSTIKNNMSITHPFIALEMQRLEKILMNWLALEKMRDPFQVIATEHRHEYQLGGLNIRVQVDRIDQLADGSHLIIDYKTGHPSIQDWFDFRPNDPQLPIYCILSQTPVHGMVFAQVRANDMRFKGVTLTEGIFPGVIPWEKMNSPLTWPEQMSLWKTILENLAAQYKEGYAKVDPKDPKKTCQHCDLPMLCRINDHSL